MINFMRDSAPKHYLRDSSATHADLIVIACCLVFMLIFGLLHS